MKLRLIAFFVIISTINIYSQKFSRQQFTLISYKVEFADDFVSRISPLASNIKAFDNNENKIEAWFVNTVYEMIVQKLSDSLSVFMLPVNSMTDKVSYDNFGYPDVYIEKAIRLSDAKYFLKINILVENYNVDINGKSLGDDKFKPKVSITLDVFNKHGYVPLQTTTGEGLAVVPVIIEPSFLAGLNFVDEKIKAKPKTETFKEIINRAILESVIALKHRPKKK